MKKHIEYDELEHEFDIKNDE